MRGYTISELIDLVEEAGISCGITQPQPRVWILDLEAKHLPKLGWIREWFHTQREVETCLRAVLLGVAVGRASGEKLGNERVRKDEKV